MVDELQDQIALPYELSSLKTLTLTIFLLFNNHINIFESLFIILKVLTTLNSYRVICLQPSKAYLSEFVALHRLPYTGIIQALKL